MLLPPYLALIYKTISAKKDRRRKENSKMSLTRKMLKAMSIDDEKIEQIIEAHTETVDGLKQQIVSAQKNAEDYTAVKKELDALKASNSEDFKSKYEKEHSDFEAFKKQQSDKETRTAKETAYRELLRVAGISEKRIDKILKLSPIDEIELEENGKIKDEEKYSSQIKEEWSEFIETTTQSGADTANPPANTGSSVMTKAEIYKKDSNGRYILSASERQKALEKSLKTN